MFKRKALKPPEEPDWETSERSDEWNQRRSYSPMEVTRTEDGSPVPAYDGDWDDATKLQWEAGLLKADTGFAVAFYQPSSGRRDKVDWSAFGVVAPNGTAALTSIRVRDFTAFKVGVEWGIRWARDEVSDERSTG